MRAGEKKMIEREAVNLEHANNPVAGDYWHEFFAGQCLILAVSPEHVIVCRKVQQVDAGHWAWDLDHLEILTRAEFLRFLQYDTRDGFWCDCVPVKGGYDYSRVAAEWLHKQFNIASQAPTGVEIANADLYNTVYNACLDATQKLGPDIKKLSWFGRFWKGKRNVAPVK